MILFFDKRDGKIFGTVDGRVHDEEFAKSASMSSSNIPDEYVGKLVVPTRPVTEVIEVPVIERVADPNDGFKVKEVVVGNKKEERVRELTYDVPFADMLLRHEDPHDSLNLNKCKVSLDRQGNVKKIVEIPQ